MKKLSILILSLVMINAGYSQEFQTSIKTAKDSYKAGNLENANFALKKAIPELKYPISYYQL